MQTPIFGNLERKDRVVMVLDNPYRYEGSIYLAGKVFDSFDGRQWSLDAQGGERDCDLDALATYNAVWGYDGDYPGDYLKERTIGVRYLHLHTGYLFAPLKTWEIRLTEGRAEFGQQGGGYLFNRKQGYGTAYRLSYYQLNQGNPAFEQLILSAAGAAGSGAEEGMAGGRLRSGEEITPQEMADYRERMRRDHLGAEELSPAAEAFLRDAVAGAATDYEKLLRLESALSEFTYNERPGRLPKGVDTQGKFLDYFLADSREGYCSYFASAFVLLARREGIPARYVQGFRVPLAGRSSVEVTDGMAHAWPEAWLEGIGWIPFEPTPGSQDRISWAVHQKKEEDSEDEALKAQAAQDFWESVLGKSDEAPEEDPEALLREAERERRRELLRFLGYFLLMVLAVAILLLLADALWERKRRESRSAEESFRLEALRCMQVLAALGYSRGAFETLSELDRRVEGDMARRNLTEGEAAVSLHDFTVICEEVLYGALAPDQETVEELRAVRRELFARLREKKGRAYVLSRIALYLTRVR